MNKMEKAKFSLKDFVNSESGKATRIREPKSYKFGTKEDCKEMLMQAMELTDATIDKVNWLPEYDQIIEWMADTDGKGLFLTGSLGRGKTAILNHALPLLFKARFNKVLNPVPARYVTKSDPKQWAWAIDDLGQDVVINDFGTKKYPIQDVICDCEDHFRLLLISSNLDKGEIVDKYGGRIYDRIKRLCKIIVFKGESLRK